MERGVWTVRPDALFTKYHVRIVSIDRGSWLYPVRARRPVSVSSSVASIGCALENTRGFAVEYKPVSESPLPIVNFRAWKYLHDYSYCTLVYSYTVKRFMRIIGTYEAPRELLTKFSSITEIG